MASSSSNLTTSIHSLTEMIKLVQIKLDRNNYLYWRTLMSPILKGHGVFGYVDPMNPIPIPPTETLDSATNNPVPNPDYKEWRRLDAIILSCIYATVTEPVLAQLIGLETARETWNYLETSYFNENSARVPELRQQLQTLQKENLSMDEYWLKIKGITNVLDFVRQSLSDRDLIISTLRGLGPEYQSFVTGIMARPNLPSFYELRAFLLAEEIRLNFLPL
ncbi:hypothetical protein BVC80_1753g43 [Macleaya cordata]|uniref:Retrotransposon Copia-like N-terminal domain-containing protein n=1 Tax=Macleaya cordata TaxID=56857 RepID=A0A200QH67_MACCD|nr:hypothetical protein BVC80_1753g43 [Macleaya cordata]